MQLVAMARSVEPNTTGPPLIAWAVDSTGRGVTGCLLRSRQWPAKNGIRAAALSAGRAGRQLEAPPAGADTEETIDHLAAVLTTLASLRAPGIQRQATAGRSAAPSVSVSLKLAGKPSACPPRDHGKPANMGAPVIVDRLDASCRT